MHRAIRALLMTAVAAVPVGHAWAATSAATRTKAAPAQAVAAAPHPRTVTGPVEDMRWGPVQVTITVKGRRITDVRASAPMERPRSAFINDQAIPWLRQEVLQAQSANIDVISGATMTSEAYIASLQGALKKAHL